MASRHASSDPNVLNSLNNNEYRQSAIGNNSRLHYEICAQTTSEEQSQSTGRYMLEGYGYGRECNAPDQRQISLNERGNIHSDGYGWVSADGCLVDSDSNLRNSRNLTNPRLIQQLFERPFLTVPYMGRGLGDSDVESKLKSGVTAGERKPCNLAGVSIHPERMNICLFGNPQEVTNIVPEWRWGGVDTRMDKRRSSYNKRCGK